MPQNSIVRLWTMCSKHLAQSVRTGWRSIAFSAGLAAIAEHFGLLTVLSKLSMIVVANLAAGSVLAPPVIDAATPLVVVIDDEGFQDRYFERSPLNRCVLVKDLTKIVKRHPRRVGIDLDLSPLNATSEDERVCQQQLDQLLDAHPSSLVLLSPFAVRSTALREIKLQWMENRCRAGLFFADGRLETSLGMVVDQREPAYSGLAEVTARGLDNSICKLVSSDRNRAAATLLSPESSIANDSEMLEAKRSPINFEAAARLIPSAMTIDSDVFQSLADLSGRVVFFGGQWGNDDSFDTPIGEQPGVWIHAARFVTLDHRVTEVPKALNLVADILIAFMFSLLITSFWGLYLDLKVMEAKQLQVMQKTPIPGSWFNRQISNISQLVRRSCAWSTALVITFVGSYLMLSVTCFLISRYLFVAHGLLIAPLLIAISMLADGFVSGPVDVMTERELERNHCRRAPASTIHRFLTAVILAVAYTALLTGVMLISSEPGYVMSWIFSGSVLIVVALVLSGACLRRKSGAEPAQAPNQPTELRADQQALPGIADQTWRITQSLFSALGSVLSIVRFIAYWGVLSYAMFLVFKV